MELVAHYSYCLFIVLNIKQLSFQMLITFLGRRIIITDLPCLFFILHKKVQEF